METVYCAICRQDVPLDKDHVKIDAEFERMDDRNGRDDYTVHVGCWRSISDGWMKPV
jgi:hypothetical protein